MTVTIETIHKERCMEILLFVEELAWIRIILTQVSLQRKRHKVNLNQELRKGDRRSPLRALRLPGVGFL